MRKKVRKKSTKAKAKKLVDERIWESDDWIVVLGNLKRSPGRPRGGSTLFLQVGEKIPYAALAHLKSKFKRERWPSEGVYVSHDSMGFARYVGRGNVFGRLRERLRRHPKELKYFSFYIVSDKKHEREIETMLIRVCGDNLLFNERKKRSGIATGNVRDFEAGTYFFERQRRRGVKKK